jgi:PIN domain nuclease of toxin-antitoxin system
MNYLLDMHILIWAATGSEKLPQFAKEAIADRGNTLWVSVASLWEVAINRSMYRDEFPFDVGQFRAGLLANGYQELSIHSRHVSAFQEIPRIHTDPFDRLFVSQAISEGMILLTADKALLGFGPSVRVV